MKLVVFHGSPRLKGNTEILLEEALRGAAEKGAEVTRFDLNKMKIRGCQECGYCTDTGTCKFKDDMEKIYLAIREGERFIVTSPVFFMNVSAQLKAMIDRAQAFWCEKYLLKRPIPIGPNGRKGLFIAVGGMNRQDELKCSFLTVKGFFRTINVPEHKELGYLKADAKGAILHRPDALRECYEAGRELMS
jgi:multimeric flavodoxin WrbA